MKERESGRVYVKHLSSVNQFKIRQEMDKAVAPEAHIVSDESQLYKNLIRRGFYHEIVIHTKKEWVRGDIHTQGIDGFWPLLKRGIVSSFHQVSIKHLHCYMSEFEFRFNSREDEEIFAAVVINLVIKNALRYKDLTASEEPASPVPADDPFEPF